MSNNCLFFEIVLPNNFVVLRCPPAVQASGKQGQMVSWAIKQAWWTISAACSDAWNNFDLHQLPINYR